MSTSNNYSNSKAVVTVAHVVGMIGVVAIPVWMFALMQYYRLVPSRAGIVIGVFLAGLIASNLFFVKMLARMSGRWSRWSITGGFALAALAFYVASLQPIIDQSSKVLAVLHLIAGLGVGCALTFTHYKIGRSANPHRLFAVVNIWLTWLSLAFVVAVPRLMQHYSAAMLFTLMAALMGAAAVLMALSFNPHVDAVKHGVLPPAQARPRHIAWLVIGAVICLSFNQAMLFGFVEKIAVLREFGAGRVNQVFIAIGIINLTPSILALLLQRRLSPLAVGIGGLMVQAVLAVALSSTTGFAPFAIAASLCVFVLMFTHNFLFGLLAALDPSGRAAAATSAMLVIGACAGPVLGSILVSRAGYASLGVMACIAAGIAVAGLWQVQRFQRPPQSTGQPTFA